MEFHDLAIKTFNEALDKEIYTALESFIPKGAKCKTPGCTEPHGKCLLHIGLSLDINAVLILLNNAVVDAIYTLDDTILNYSIQQHKKHTGNIASIVKSNEQKETKKPKSDCVIPFTGNGTCSAIVASTKLDCTRAAKYINTSTDALLCGFHKNT